MSNGKLFTAISFCYAIAVAGVAAQETQSTLAPNLSMINALEFQEGEKAPYLGVFTHVEPVVEMPQKVESLNAILAGNPYISGVTMKIKWSQFHPEKNKVEWDLLEELVETASAAGKYVNLTLIPGAGSPEWIYDEGAQKAGPLSFGSQRDAYVPLPWDAKFTELYLNDLKEIAARYAEDPRVFQIQVLGHNYNPTGEEMHAPSVDSMLEYGWTRELVLENWKFWIDQYNALFPNKKLSLIVSQMYRGANAGDLPQLVAEYFVETCQGRAVLQTHQLGGNTENLTASGAICKDMAHLAPNCHEAVYSFLEERQGTAEMMVYNARLRGDNLLYLQLWRRDCNDPQYAKALVDAWEKYGAVPLEELKDRMTADGVYVPPAARGGGGAPRGAEAGAARDTGGPRGGGPAADGEPGTPAP